VSLDVSQYVAQTAVAAAREQAEPVGFNLPIEHWSPSSLAMLRRCPRQWQERYIFGRKERPGEAPVTGTAVHKGLERNFEQKIGSGVDLAMVDLLGWYDDEGWEKTIQAEQEKAGAEILWKSAPEQARARGRAMLTSYHRFVSPRIERPVGVEGWVEVDFGLAVPVQGRYDLLEEKTTTDWKTGARKQTKPKEAWRIQAAVYGEATGRPVEFHSITASSERGHVAIVTPLESPALLVQPTVREREQMRISLRALAAEACMYMEIFGTDTAWPTHGRFHDWACDWCGFRSTCPAWEE
jgi:hypothetical protein